MKTLLLMRHAKSDRSRSGLQDVERPLAPRGERDAGAMGRFLAEAGWVPGLVVASPAERARATARIAAAAGAWRCPESEDLRLYEGSAEVVAAVVRELDDGVDRALLCGHEPTWSQLTAMLVGGGRLRMPTAAVAAVAFDVGSWSEALPGSGELQWLVVPRLVTALAAGGGR